MTLSLFKISKEYKEKFDMLVDLSDQIDQETIKNTLESISTDVENKILNIAAFCKNLEREIEAMKEYEHSMKIRRERNEHRIKNMKSYMKSCMDYAGIKKVKGLEFNVSIRKNQSALQIIDESKVPDDLFIIKKEPNKAKIKSLLKNGYSLNYAKLTNSESLIIK